MKKLLIFIYLAVNTMLLFSLQWPVEKRILKASFGERRGDYYHTGIDIGGGEQQVVSVADGEVVYYQDGENNSSVIPSGLGNFIILEHDRQLRTTYAHLKNNSIIKDRDKFTAGEVLGLIGDSGAANGPHLHFEVIDRELNEIVNPLVLLPALGDRTKPVIKDVFIKSSSGGEYQKLVNRSEIKAGKYDLSALLFDTSEHVNYYCQIAPYKINIYINGEETAVIIYNSIRKNGNSLVMSSNLKSINDYYISEDNWQVYIGQFELKAGTVRIEISVSDYAGNEAVREFLVISRK